MLKEVIYETEKLKPNTKENCPYCGGMMCFGRINCPENKEGCLVLHQGYRCLSCERVYIETPD